MKIDRALIRNLGQTAFVMNAIDGGTVMPRMSLDKKQDQYIYNLRLPGVSSEDFNVEIDSHNLFIYQLMRLDSEMEIPYMVKRLVIPAEVNYELITAEFDGGKLKIVMPFNELANGYHRDIEIIKKT